MEQTDMPDSSPTDELQQDSESNTEATQSESSGETSSTGDSLLEENRQLRDQLLRTIADFENYRRRVNSERLEIVSRANEKLLLNLLPLVDDFQRSILSAENNAESGTFFDGVKMIYSKLIKFLELEEVKRINTIGMMFDANNHEALLHQPSDEPEGTIIGEIESGYTIGDRILRFPKVIVSSGT